MSLQKHTSGPWEVKVSSGIPFGSVSCLECSPNRTIAVYSTIQEKALYQEREANAHLIAAAPELLEALTKLRNEVLGILAIAKPWLIEDAGNTNVAVLEQRLDLANLAIEKAIGGTK